MANPFEATFDSDCGNCGELMEEGEMVFAHESIFMCEDCAEDKGIICSECGGKKNPEFDHCYKCVFE